LAQVDSKLFLISAKDAEEKWNKILNFYSGCVGEKTRVD